MRTIARRLLVRLVIASLLIVAIEGAVLAALDDWAPYETALLAGSFGLAFMTYVIVSRWFAGIVFILLDGAVLAIMTGYKYPNNEFLGLSVFIFNLPFSSITVVLAFSLWFSMRLGFRALSHRADKDPDRANPKSRRLAN